MNFPCQGHFWLPGSADRSVFGTLTFTRRNGAALSLADSLSADRDTVEADVVLGQTAGGDYLTLLHVIRTQAPLFRLTPTYPCSYHATFLITGAAFDSCGRHALFALAAPCARVETMGGQTRIRGRGFRSICGPGLPGGPDYRTPDKQVLLSDTDGLDLTLAFWP